MRSLANLPPHSNVFVDANIFAIAYSHQGNLGTPARDFLERTKRKEIQGFTSTFVVAEVVHRVMVAEAQEQLNLPSRVIVEHLQQHPELVRSLTQHLGVASDIRKVNINILPLTVKDLHASKIVRTNHGLLTNDSLIVAVMRGHKLRHLVSHDAAFDQVAGLTVWGPGA